MNVHPLPHPAPPQKRWHTEVWLGIFAVCVAAVFLVVALVKVPRDTPAPTQQTAAATRGKPVTIATYSGAGSKVTDTYAASGHTRISYSYKCDGVLAESGGSNFAVTVEYQGDNGLGDMVINEVGVKNSDSSDSYHAGEVRLNVLAQCPWKIIVYRIS